MKERITTIMTKERLTPTKFAEILKIQPSNISHLLSGRNKPSFELLLKIKEAFPHISGDWLISGNGSYNVIAERTSLPTPLNPILSTNKSLFDQEPLVEPPSIENSSNTPFTSISDTHAIPSEIPKEVIGQEISGKLKKVLLIYDDNTFEEVVSRSRAL